MSTINKPVLIVNGNPVGDISQYAEDDKVEVIADGVKTYSELLKDLNADVTKLTDMSVILVGGQIFNFAYSGSEYWFTCTNIDGTTQKMTFHRLRRLSNGNWSCVKIDTTNVITDNSSDLIPNGTKITLYYGNKNLAVDLQTHANKCMMSDGVSTAESKLNGYDTLTSMGDGRLGFQYVMGTDLDTIKTSGFYELAFGNTNVPVWESEWSVLLVVGNGSDTGAQINIVRTGAMYARALFSGSWTAWKPVAFS